MSRKTTTSSEVKTRWKAKAYKTYQVNLRVEDDAGLIEYIEKNKLELGTTNLFKNGIELLIKEEEQR